MSHDSKPTAEYVKTFAKELETYWASQDAEDEAALSVLNLKNRIAAAVSKDTPAKPQALRVGLLAQQNDRDASAISIRSFIRFNPPDPNEPKDRKHANFLESWTNSALLKSGYDGIMVKRLSDSDLDLGRSWTKTTYDPTRWADEHMESLVEKKEKAESEDEKSDVDKEMDAYRRDNWPLTIEFVPARKTWPEPGSLDGKHYLSEVVQIRKMRCSAIKNAYDMDCGCTGKGQTDHDIYVYGNHQWEATVIGGKEPKLTHIWQHGMGKSQYSLEESRVARENDNNVRWLSAIYAVKDLSNTYDELMSDWKTNTHETAQTHLMQIYDPDKREMQADGKPPVQKIDPGGTSSWWLGEDLKPVTILPLTEQHRWYMTHLKEQLESGSLRSAITRGETKSGDAQTLFASAVKLAERDLEPRMAARRLADEDRAKTLLRSVVAINKEYPEYPDKLWVYDRFPQKGKKGGALGASPKDVIGWEEAVQARAERAFPADRNQDMAYATGLQNLRISIPDILEELGKEDPDAMVERGLKEQLVLHLFDTVVKPAAQQRAVQRLQEPPKDAEAQIAAQLPNASPPVQNMLSQALGQPAVDGTQLQAQANMRRSGVPQQPQVPV